MATGESAAGAWRRLLTPDLGAVAGGVWIVLGAIATLVLLEPMDIDNAWRKGWGALGASLAVWGPVAVACLGGTVAVGVGLWGLAARDRAEAVAHETPDGPSSHVEGAVGWGIVAATGLLGGGGLGLVAAMSTRSRGIVEVGVLAGVLGLLGLLAGGAAWARAARPRRGTPRPTAPAGRSVPHLQIGWLVLLTVLAVGLQLSLVRWIVEDAAISFAYARHLAAGEGLVTYPGGEWVEGYSNPLWTFLIALGYLVGVDGFTSNKVFSVVFAAATVPLVWVIAREARPHRADGVPVVAAALLAINPQFIIWGAGGLENSLLNVLIALGIGSTLVEARRGGWPFSALAWVGVALTRPEGILYAFFAGLWAMIFRVVLAAPEVRRAWETGEGLPRALWRATWPTLAWLLTFFGPFGLYQAWRYQAFAWEFPNTYYAKKGRPSKQFSPFRWTSRGWGYLREYAFELWTGFLVPLYLLGLSGWRGVRGGVYGAAILAFVAVLIVPGPDWLQQVPFWDLDAPRWFVKVRVWTLLGIAVALVVSAVGRPGWRALTLCGSVLGGSVFFVIYAGSDWMGGYRWLATSTVPGSILLAVGLGELADAVRRIDRWSAVPGIATAAIAALVGLGLGIAFLVPPSRSIPALGWRIRDVDPWMVLGMGLFVGLAIALGRYAGRRRVAAVRWGPLGWTVVLGGLAAVALPAVHHLDRFQARPTTSPWKVKRRANYMNYVQRRVHMTDPPVNLDVDMGATMYWSGDVIVDIAGLVDVPMGQHWFEPAFSEEYIYEERRPDFAHLHGGWASTSKLKRREGWKGTYLELPPYPTGRNSQHEGNHIARRHLITEAWDGAPGRRVPFEGGVILEGWEAPVVGTSGGHLYVELAWRSVLRDRQAWERFRPVLVLEAGDRLVTWDVPPGYDWYHPDAWAPDEVVFGRYSLPVPPDLPAGEHTLRLVVVGGEEAESRVWAAWPADPDAAALLGREVDAEGKVRAGGGAAVAPDEKDRDGDAADGDESAERGGEGVAETDEDGSAGRGGASAIDGPVTLDPVAPGIRIPRPLRRAQERRRARQERETEARGRATAGEMPRTPEDGPVVVLPDAGWPIGGRAATTPVLSRGEVVLGAVRIVAPPEAATEAARLRDQARARAAQGSCAQAEATWWRARRTRTRSPEERVGEEAVATDLAACFARQADAAATREDRLFAFRRAHRWDHHAPTLRALAAPHAADAWERGLVARADKDWEAAYDAFSMAVALEPWRSWARRYAEEARDCRLRIRLDEHDCGAAP